ncbi:hypothetical protein K438DRAFT_1778398 [Mycena galopus ATCC 62051]|nr:hypothetical protein K438DRAFT_1778398 [Mycena galopus ATCC 62051]
MRVTAHQGSFIVQLRLRLWNADERHRRRLSLDILAPGVRCSASAESFVYAAGVSQLTRSGGSASQLTCSEGGSQLTHSEGGLMLPPTRGEWRERMRMGFMPAEDTTAEADGEKYSQEQTSTGEQRLTGDEEVSAMSRGALHEGGVGGGCMGVSGEETGSGQCRQLGVEAYGVGVV